MLDLNSTTLCYQLGKLDISRNRGPENEKYFGTAYIMHPRFVYLALRLRYLALPEQDIAESEKDIERQ